MATSDKLYNRELLGLAMRLADYPVSDDMACKATARSRTCGSEVTIACDPSDLGKLGASVSACAVGQAAAAIFLASANLHDRERIATIAQGLPLWLSGEGEMPDWPGLATLSVALPHPARHEAILLPWKAALAVLSKVHGHS